MADALAFVIGQTKLVDLYVSGALSKDAEEEAAASGTAAGPSTTDASRRNVEELALNQEQLAFEREISGRLDLARKANHSSDAEEAEEAREVAMDKKRPVIGLGPRGTGKTTVVTKASRRPAACISRPWSRSPPRSWPRACGQDLDKVDVDTLHAAFKIDGEEAEGSPLMAPNDLVVIDELFQLDQGQFERILRLWRVADKVPALIFLSDKWIGATGRSDLQGVEALPRTFGAAPLRRGILGSVGPSRLQRASGSRLPVDGREERQGGLPLRSAWSTLATSTRSRAMSSST